MGHGGGEILEMVGLVEETMFVKGRRHTLIKSVLSKLRIQCMPL